MASARILSAQHGHLETGTGSGFQRRESGNGQNRAAPPPPPANPRSRWSIRASLGRPTRSENERRPLSRKRPPPPKRCPRTTWRRSVGLRAPLAAPSSSASSTDSRSTVPESDPPSRAGWAKLTHYRQVRLLDFALLSGCDGPTRQRGSRASNAMRGSFIQAAWLESPIRRFLWVRRGSRLRNVPLSSEAGGRGARERRGADPGCWQPTARS